MKHNSKTVLPLAVLAMASFFMATSANAGVININNAGFEDASIPAGNGNLGTVADWTEENAGQVFVDDNGLQWTPESDRTLYLNAANAAANQDLSHNWSSSDNYTLGLIGIEPQWRIAGAGDAFSVQLRETDGTVLWDSGSQSVDGTVSGSPGSVSYTGTGHIFSWTIDASTFGGAGVVEGSQLNIRIAHAGGAPYMDDVSLSVIAIPEPASLSLLGLGGLAMLLRRRRHFAVDGYPKERKRGSLLD